MKRKPEFQNRHLEWDGCYNIRDLGGLPLDGGGQTHRGVLVRADMLNRLTAAGRQALKDYGIGAIIDLRGPREVANEPSPYANQAGQNGRPVYHNLPLERYEPEIRALIKQATTRAEVYCIILDHYPENFRDVMQAIIRAPAGGVVFHCHSGKDRTGTIAALLLRLAGVPDEVIGLDYAESQVRLWPLYEKIVAEAGGEDKIDFWLKPTATAETMDHMLGHLDATYGGVESYLERAGLTPAELYYLQQLLVE